MTDALADVLKHIDSRSDSFVDELRDFVQHPSRTGYLDEVRACASYVAALLQKSGWRAEVIDVDELAPIVFAELPAPPGAETILMYSHYDVISPEPVEEWSYPPFSATLVNGRIIGRGSTDAKANVLALLKGVESFISVAGVPPCGVKLILDGEEERGSSNLPLFVDAHRQELAADAALSFDGSLDASGLPKISIGTSGMLYVELEAQGAGRELHSSGSRLYPNPAWRLVWALASIKDAQERVTIPGFYDDVVPPSARDREMMAAMPWDDRLQLAQAGLDSFLTGVRGLDAVERLIFQPGLAICGLAAGFSGEGMKSVIPGKASAKVEFRIVQNQTPAHTLELLRAHLDRLGFADVTISTLATVEASKTEPDAEFVRAVVEAARAVYGGGMLKPTSENAGRQGAWLGRRLGIPGVSTGIGPPGHRGHATDEFVTVEHFVKGIKFAATIVERFASP